MNVPVSLNCQLMGEIQNSFNGLFQKPKADQRIERIKNHRIRKHRCQLHKIAVIGGDGIGPEVTREACIILSALQDSLPELKLEFTEFDWGSEYF